MPAKRESLLALLSITAVAATTSPIKRAREHKLGARNSEVAVVATTPGDGCHCRCQRRLGTTEPAWLVAPLTSNSSDPIRVSQL